MVLTLTSICVVLFGSTKRGLLRPAVDERVGAGKVRTSFSLGYCGAAVGAGAGF